MLRKPYASLLKFSPNQLPISSFVELQKEVVQLLEDISGHDLRFRQYLRKKIDLGELPSLLGDHCFDAIDAEKITAENFELTI